MSVCLAAGSWEAEATSLLYAVRMKSKPRRCWWQRGQPGVAFSTDITVNRSDGRCCRRTMAPRTCTGRGPSARRPAGGHTQWRAWQQAVRAPVTTHCGMPILTRQCYSNCMACPNAKCQVVTRASAWPLMYKLPQQRTCACMPNCTCVVQCLPATHSGAGRRHAPTAFHEQDTHVVRY